MGVTKLRQKSVPSMDISIYSTLYNYESKVSLVLRQYMRGENGTEFSGFFFCLAYLNRKTNCQNYRKIKGGQGQNNQLFENSLVSVKSIEKVTSTQEQVQKYCNWRKEALFRL